MPTASSVKATTLAISADSGASGPKPQCSTQGASSAPGRSEPKACASQGRAGGNALPKNPASGCSPCFQAAPANVLAVP